MALVSWWDVFLVRLGWYRIRLPGELAPLGLQVAETLDADEEDSEEERLLGLLTTNMNIASKSFKTGVCRTGKEK